MRPLLLIFTLLAFECFVAYSQNCPNDCSGNGWCNPDTLRCNCNTGWRGEDCSISNEALTVNRPRTGRVSKLQWRFYNYIVPKNKAHRITLTHPSNQDPDLFLRRSAPPSRSNYDYAQMGLNNESFIDVGFNDADTQWFAGVYGFTTADFTITLSEFSTECPLDCNNHGTCDAERKVCECNVGYGGPSCDIAISVTPKDTWVEKTLPRNGWHYVYFQVPDRTSVFRLNVEETSSNADVDVYIKKSLIPSFARWDYAHITTETNFWLNATSPESGVYYIGFFGYKASSFRYKLTLESPTNNECANKCSEHGTCNNGMCRCDGDFFGQICEDKTNALEPNEVATGYLQYNVYNYYHAHTHTTNNLVIYVTHEGGDCDLFVHNGNNVPSRFNYLYQHISLEKDFNLTIPNPGNNRWNFAVYGFATCRYQIHFNISDSGCPDCVHGRCAEGQSLCICDDGWGGDDCSIEVANLAPYTKASGQVTQHTWKYYKLTGSGSAFHITLKDERGVAWLFMSIMAPPTINRFDLSDTKLFSPSHRISIEIGQFIPETTFYIGVYGSPYAIGVNNYELVAWSAPFK